MPVHYVHVGSVQWHVIMLSWWARMHAGHYRLSSGNTSFVPSNMYWSQSRWPRGLRQRSVAIHLLRLCVRIPLGAWMSVCCECCRVEVSATSWSLVQRSPTDRGASCDLEASWMRRHWSSGGGLLCQNKIKFIKACTEKLTLWPWGWTFTV